MHPVILRRVQQEPALLEAHSDVHVEEVVEKGDCAVDRNDLGASLEDKTDQQPDRQALGVC